ncbi:serine hydrolase domain-containing protein [Jatrophihabitans fulvus]
MNVTAADELLHEGVAAGLWPGVVAAVGVGSEVQRTWVLGQADTTVGRPFTADTVFDLASLTKVLVTTPLALRHLALDAAVREYLPDVDPRLTVEYLLTHTSGLPAHVRFTATSSDELVRQAAAVPLEAGPGTRVAYSDIGFVLVGGAVVAVSGRPLDELADGLPGGARFRPPASWAGRIAATEIYDGVPTLGVVHDENAQLAGGVAGHAGLFGSLADVLALLAPWRDGTWPSDAFRDRTAGLGGHRGLGWTCRGDGHDILSAGWGDGAVSHTGFTGTSVALDPVTGRWAVLLTNHVHFGRGRPEVFAARRRWHAVLVED